MNRLDYIFKIISPNIWTSFGVSIIISAFLIGTLEYLSYNSLGGALLSCLLCYTILAFVIVFHSKKICGISTGSAILVMILASVIGSIIIIVVEETIFSNLISYNHPLKHNRFIEWFLPCLGIGSINMLATYICSGVKTKNKNRV